MGVYDTLFVGDLPHSVNSDKLRELFEEHVPEAKGGMSRVRIMGMQGYGFVSFKVGVRGGRGDGDWGVLLAACEAHSFVAVTCHPCVGVGVRVGHAGM